MKRIRPEPPPCRRVQKWCRQRGLSTAPLTGQDARALAAFVHLVELWGGSDDNGQERAVTAMRAVVLAMLPHNRQLAKASIPMVLDWGHEDRIWSALELGEHDIGCEASP